MGGAEGLCGNSFCCSCSSFVSVSSLNTQQPSPGRQYLRPLCAVLRTYRSSSSSRSHIKQVRVDFVADFLDIASLTSGKSLVGDSIAGFLDEVSRNVSRCKKVVESKVRENPVCCCQVKVVRFAPLPNTTFICADLSSEVSISQAWIRSIHKMKHVL